MSSTSKVDERLQLPFSTSTPSVEPGFGTLVGGIISDVQSLLQNHLDLFTSEIRKDFLKTKQAAVPYLMGLAFGALSVSLLAAMLVGLLSWAVPSVPWWGWCGILSAAFTIVAALLYFNGKAKFESFNPLPDESAQALIDSVAKIAHPSVSLKVDAASRPG